MNNYFDTDYFDFDKKSESKTKQRKNQQQQLLLLLLLVAGATYYYFMVYLPEEETKTQQQTQVPQKSSEELQQEMEEDAWDKGRIWELPVQSWADIAVNKMKSILVRKYQEDASVFPNGDRDERFYFSRSASYAVHFPPTLRENYERAKKAEIDCSLLENTEELILSEEIMIWEKRVLLDPTRGKPDADKKDNSALFYGAPGTGKTRTMQNICVQANKYPLVEIKGAALTPSKDDQDSGLLPLKKFQYTISELEWSLVKECGLEREANGEVRYILFVDEADQISNNALTHDPTKLRFLKDCLEGVDATARSSNLWVFATNYLNDVDKAVYREGRLSNPLSFDWNWNEFKKYAEKYGILSKFPEKWQKTNFLKPEDNEWVKRFNKKLFQKEFLGDDLDNPGRPRFWDLFIEKNPDAQYDPRQDEQSDEEDSDNNEEPKLKDIEIGEFLEFFWNLYDSRSLMSYDGKFQSFQKPTVEKVLEVQFTNLINKIDEQLDDIIGEMENTRSDKREETRADIIKIFEILGKR